MGFFQVFSYEREVSLLKKVILVEVILTWKPKFILVGVCCVSGLRQCHSPAVLGELVKNSQVMFFLHTRLSLL